MNIYAKVIFLYFKKGFTFREIADLLPDDLRGYNEFRYCGKPQTYPPLIAVQKIVGNEVAMMYEMGRLDDFQSLRKFVVGKNDEDHRNRITRKKEKFLITLNP